MQRWLACALLLGAGGCRPKACDDAALLRAATVFEDRSSEGRGSGLEALAEACPALPPGLRTDLRRRFRHAPGDTAATATMPPIGDEAHAALFLRTCPRTPEERNAALEAADLDDALRTSCKVDRYGVLAVDEPFVRDDIVAFMLYEWQTATGADPDIARTLARALMYVSAAEEERKLVCRHWGDGCEHVIARLGIELPRSTANTERDGGVEVTISRTHVSVEGEQVLVLADGGFDRHVAPTLLTALEARADADPGVIVQADLATRFETLASVAFTATKAGYERIDLAVFEGRRIKRIPLAVPREWMRPREWPRMERALALELHVHRDAVEVAVSGQGTTFAGVPSCASADCPTHAALTEHMVKFKELFPHETVATFVVDGDVPLQVLVSVMDIARGVDCRLPYDDGEIPEDCLFWQAIIETDPGLFWNIDRIVAIHLGEPSVELREAGGVKPKAILGPLASERGAIEACLLAQLPLLRVLGDELFLAVARSPDGGKLVAHVLEKGFDGTPLERCVLDPLGLALPIHTPGSDFLHDVGLEVTIPVTLDLR